MVGRLLPFREKRAVGPFVFIDHMGPAHLSDHENMDVPPHPHIGLSTLTFLFEGSIMHRDSLGTELEIKPGAVNWMTAGKGIVHSERTGCTQYRPRRRQTRRVQRIDSAFCRKSQSMPSSVQPISPHHDKYAETDLAVQ